MAVSAKPPSQASETTFRTLSGEPVREVYTPADLSPQIGGPEDPVGRPGEYPYTRGIHSSMYRGRLWTMRQFAGFGTPRQTNERFKFLFHLGLVEDERLEQIVRERHVAAGFPVADRMGLAKFALERSFRAHIEPKRQVRTQGHFVQTVQVVALNPARGGTGNECVKVAVRQNDEIGAQRGDDAVLELIVEISGVHQGHRHARDGVFG